MTYIFIRVAFFVIIFIVTVILIRKYKKNNKKLIILSFMFCTILGSFSHLIPFENCFIKFNSPEEVFDYIGSGEIIDIIYGKDSCMIVYSKGENTFSHTIILKPEKYKIASYFSIKRESVYLEKYGDIKIYNVSGCSDVYLVGYIIMKDNEEPTIEDINNIEFNVIKTNEFNNTITIMVYSYVENISDDYYILINGEKFYLK